jgi:hypothetical protein
MKIIPLSAIFIIPRKEFCMYFQPVVLGLRAVLKIHSGISAFVATHCWNDLPEIFFIRPFIKELGS